MFLRTAAISSEAQKAAQWRTLDSSSSSLDEKESCRAEESKMQEVLHADMAKELRAEAGGGAGRSPRRGSFIDDRALGRRPGRSMISWMRVVHAGIFTPRDKSVV